MSFIIKGLSAILFLLLLPSCGISGAPANQPFSDLTAADIESASVYLIPPGKTVEIAEFKELADYLADVVIHEEDNSYTEYYGQNVTFTVEKTNGTQVTVMAYNSFIVIDGVGYRCEYAPCEALSSYANRLLKQTDLSEKPEEIKVVSIVNRAEEEGLDCADAEEPFFSDENNVYIFPCIMSQYVVVNYSDGSQKGIKEVLEAGDVTVTDLDTYGIFYHTQPKTDSFEETDGPPEGEYRF